MNQNIAEKIHQMNYIFAETDALYHQAALKLELSDSAMIILYAVHDNGGECLLSEVYQGPGLSKQTINSALRKLEKENILYLEQCKGRAKKIVLTEKGKAYVKQTVARLFYAEQRAYESWTEEELDVYLRLSKKYVEALREQIKSM